MLLIINNYGYFLRNQRIEFYSHLYELQNCCSDYFAPLDFNKFKKKLKMLARKDEEETLFILLSFGFANP